jgi:hypothetical protein
VCSGERRRRGQAVAGGGAGQAAGTAARQMQGQILMKFARIYDILVKFAGIFDILVKLHEFVNVYANHSILLCSRTKHWTEPFCFTILTQLNTKMKPTHFSRMKPLHSIPFRFRTDHTLR